MTELQVFSRLSWAAWQARYCPHIRTSIDWDGLRAHRPTVIQELSEYIDNSLYFPWYKGGRGKDGWRDGRRQRVPPRGKPALMRVPAARYKGQTILLDGCHRVKDQKPVWLVLDIICLTSKNHRYVTDFL